MSTHGGFARVECVRGHVWHEYEEHYTMAGGRMGRLDGRKTPWKSRRLAGREDP